MQTMENAEKVQKELKNLKIKKKLRISLGYKEKDKLCNVDYNPTNKMFHHRTNRFCIQH